LRGLSGLGGYDAVHLGEALEWYDRTGAPITVATFDQNLWGAGGGAVLYRFPEDLKQLVSKG
jgi:hypothetical protein